MRVPDAEEISSSQSSRSSSTKDASAKKTSSSASSSSSAKNYTGQRERVVVKSKTSPFLFFLILIAMGGGGFNYWQLMQSQNQLASANARIADLESRLEMTGDETEASAAAMQAKLKWADSEIRKLWGVSYDRNKKDIANNKTKIDALSGKLKRVGKDAVAGVKKQMGEVTGELALLNELVSANQASVTNLETSSQSILNQTRQLQDTLGKLETKEAELRRNVRTNEQAIEAIDAFRRNVNQQLLQLKSSQ